MDQNKFAKGLLNRSRDNMYPYTQYISNLIKSGASETQ